MLVIDRRESEPNQDDEQPDDVPPEVPDDRHQRAEVERDVEGLVELVVLLKDLPVGKPRHEDQVTGRADREQLGRALDDAEHERLPVRECAFLLADAEDREQNRERERRAGSDVDGRSSAHRRGVLPYFGCGSSLYPTP